jgi:hypothetical protein
MGLDSVELIMAIEDEFGVTIPTENAPQLAILGDMHAFIICKLQQQGRNLDESEVCERRLKSAARGGRKVQRWGWVESTPG